MDLSKYSNKEFVVTGKQSEEYGEAVQQTAKLLKRPFMQMHRLFTREDWTLEEIKRYYMNATKHNGNCPPEVKWWADRKRRNAKN